MKEKASIMNGGNGWQKEGKKSLKDAGYEGVTESEGESQMEDLISKKGKEKVAAGRGPLTEIAACSDSATCDVGKEIIGGDSKDTHVEHQKIEAGKERRDEGPIVGQNDDIQNGHC
jgi:hypothetical protein